MQSLSCFLISKRIETDSIGVQKEISIEKEVGIIAIEDIYEKEFYKANENGFKPTLRLKLSNLSCNNENELKYQNTYYTVIRTQDISADVVVLVCQRKIKDVK